jgi:hypothetical protein
MISKARTQSLMASFFALSLVLSVGPISVRAHTFSPNESASFLSLVDQIKSALSPIESDVSTNLTLAKEQGQYARMLVTNDTTKELKERNERLSTKLLRMLDSLQNITTQNVDTNLANLDDVLAEAVTVRIDQDHLENATIQALAFANDINKILDEYTATFTKDGAANVNDMNMSSMNMNQNHSMDNMKSNSSSEQDIKNLAAYQRASALINIATDRFNAELKEKSNATSTIDEVVKGLEQLKISVQSKSPASSVMSIVHGEIHPNLQTAFNLQLAQNTNAKHGSGNMSALSSMANMSKNNESMQSHGMNIS